MSGWQGFARFVVRRLATGVVQLIIVVAAVFALLRILPADPTIQLLGTQATPADYAAKRAELGLDATFLTQLGRYAGHVIRGDLGASWINPGGIGNQIAEAMPVSLQLVVLSLLLALLIVIPLGLFSALRPGNWLSQGARAYSLMAGSLPDFWLGLMFVFVFWHLLGWFPSPLGLLDSFTFPPPTHTHFILIDAIIAGDWSVLSQALYHFALPILTFTFVLSGPFLKMVRESALAGAHSEYMLYARAIALPRRAQWSDLLRNSLSPLLTLVGVYFAGLLGGTVVLESVFSLNGMGRYTLASVQQLDFPVVQSAVLVLTGLSLAVYLLMDILYRVIDPRVGFGARR